MYQRTLSNNIVKRLGSGKAIVLLGPRQVGKTTLIKNLVGLDNYLFLDGDDPQIRALLDQPNTADIKNIIGKNKTVFIDEAQRITNIGLTAKIIVDQIKDVQLIISGSSSFDLHNLTNEPLTGRKWEYQLHPISWEEYENEHGFLHAEQNLENRLIFGFYPDVLNHPGDEPEILNNLLNSYLYRDLLNFSGLRKPEFLEKIISALAFQVGNEVNYNELAQTVGIDKNTVIKYIDVLIKGFVIFKLGSYSGNLRNEIKRNQKIYFYDNGIRNAIIGDLSPISTRQDKGALWENFLVTERLKMNHYYKNYTKCYFWRTK